MARPEWFKPTSTQQEWRNELARRLRVLRRLSRFQKRKGLAGTRGMVQGFFFGVFPL